MKVYQRGREWDVDVRRFIGMVAMTIAAPTFVVSTMWPSAETPHHDQYTATSPAGTSTEEVFVPATDETPTPEPTVTETVARTPTPPPPSPSSAAPPPVAPAFAPTKISIPKLKINTLVIAKPTVTAWSSWLGKNVSSFGVAEKGDKNPATGKTIDPMRVAVWWSSGPKVGAGGGDGQLAIILGHTHSTSFGIFNELGKLAPGDLVTMSADKPKVAFTFAVLKTVGKIPKSDESALNQVLMNPPKGATMAIITCSGLVKRTIDDSRSHEQNTVVFLGSPVQTPGS